MKKILVVEDDPAVQRALKRLFEAEEFAVEIKSDGKSGLEAFRTAAPSAVSTTWPRSRRAVGSAYHPSVRRGGGGK